MSTTLPPIDIDAANPTPCPETKNLTTFRAPWWLPGGHLQTIYTAKIAPRPKVPFHRQRWLTPDGDFIDVDRINGLPDKPLLLLFHGMEGSSNSSYATAIMSHIQHLGWSSIIPHFRSCSGELNHAPRFYHCADYHEADWIIRRIHQEKHPDSPLYAMGVSLGGNVLMHWLAQNQHQAEIITAAAVVCPPVDVAAGGKALATGISRLYCYSFLRTLKPKALQKLKQHPGLYCPQKLKQCRSIYEFDSLVTAPLHGFKSVEEYWQAASTHNLMPDITVPTLLIATLNDPCVPASSIPRQNAGAVHIEISPTGGHLGFTHGPCLPGKNQWLPQRLTGWFLHGQTR